MKRILLLITILPVLVVVILVFTSSRAKIGSVSQLPISSALDGYLDISEFSYSDVPLGSNEAIEEKTLDILQFDDYLQRQYDIGDSELVLFIAYWNPTNASQRLAGQHNPDICWVKSGGWKELQRSSGVRFKVHGSTGSPQEEVYREKLASNSLLLAPIEYRLLETPHGAGEETQFHTYFWQVLENEVKPIERVGPGSYWEYFKTIPDRIRAKRYPMWFIRIHSKVPLAPIADMADGGWKMANEKNERLEQGARSKELGKSTRTSDLTPSPSTDTKYLVDYPEVRELLLAIHEMTTGEAKF